ncbi:type II toxin-antitoxin system PemK/MazF family toxin [bacterium]|nr:type II toxin-antitoxin system PemK/MazF family toxin [bacterium]
MPRVFNRGDVWIVDLGPVAKIRPAVVVSIPFEDQDRALITLIPHTTSVRGSRFEVASQARFLKRGAFDAQNPISIPPPHLVRRLGRIHSDELTAGEAAMTRWLGLKQE